MFDLNKKKQRHLVVFTGAGVSADSGISTFRDNDGLWDKYRIEDVCTSAAIVRNRELVIDFYNQRRREVLEKEPNPAHYAIAELEKYFDVDVITQNIDNLHERAGSTKVTHLHGEITKLRSSKDELATVPLQGWEQDLEARHPDGSLLRPYIVFFGEGVPYFPVACDITSTADIFLVIGTSLNVYPAASLLECVKPNVPIIFVDPGQPQFGPWKDRIVHVQKKAAEGVPELCKVLIEDYK